MSLRHSDCSELPTTAWLPMPSFTPKLCKRLSPGLGPQEPWDTPNLSLQGHPQPPERRDDLKRASVGPERVIQSLGHQHIYGKHGLPGGNGPEWVQIPVPSSVWQSLHLLGGTSAFSSMK